MSNVDSKKSLEPKPKRKIITDVKQNEEDNTVEEEGSSSDHSSQKEYMTVTEQKLKKKTKKHETEIEQLQEQVEQLQEHTEEMKLELSACKEFVGSVKDNFNDRAMEKTIAVYFEKIANNLHKDCGERPQNTKLREKNMLGELYQSEDSVQLARAADKLADKIQIIGMNLLNFKKFKNTAGHSLYELENRVDKHITLDFFRKEHEELQTKIHEIVDIKLSKLSASVKGYNDSLNEALEKFQAQVNEIRKEATWRLPELETMVKARITETKAMTVIREIETKHGKEIKQMEAKMIDRLYNSFKECNTKVETAVDFTEHRYADTKRELLHLSSKIENTIEKVKFAELQLDVRVMKKTMEEEIDLVQKFAREARDK